MEKSSSKTVSSLFIFPDLIGGDPLLETRKKTVFFEAKRQEKMVWRITTFWHQSTIDDDLREDWSLF